MAKRVGFIVALLGAGVVGSGLAVAHARQIPTGGAARAKNVRPSTPKTVRVPRSALDDLVADPDGSLRVATDGQTRNTDPNSDGEQITTGRLVARSFNASGRAGVAWVSPGQTKTTALSDRHIAFTSTGSVETSFAFPRRGPSTMTSTMVAHVVSRDRAGHAISDDPLALRNGDEPGIGYAGVDRVIAGATGAVIVSGLEAPDDQAADDQATWFAFRPAGAAHIGPAVELSTGSEGGVGFSFVLGPDGGGAVIGHPPSPRSPFVRRISPAGELGPELPMALPAGVYVSTTSDFGPSGTLVIALSTQPVKKSKGPDPALYVSTLAPDALAPTAPAPVAGGTGAAGEALVVGPDDRTILAAYQEHKGLVVFDGPPADLRPIAHMAAGGYDTATLLQAPGGATTILMNHELDRRTGRDEILAARRPAGATHFGSTVRVSSSGASAAYLDAAVTTADGNVAIAYRDFDRTGFYLTPAIWP